MTVDEVDEDELRKMLEESRRLGFLGERPVDEVIAHARVFARALADAGIESIVDLGAGGGVPGLVIASDMAGAHLTMVDRRAKRTDFLERMVRRQGWDGRVIVLCADAHRFADDYDAAFGGVVARGFGPPEETIRLASRLVRSDGLIVISEPPVGDRWTPKLLRELELTRLDVRDSDGRVAVFRRRKAD